MFSASCVSRTLALTVCLSATAFFPACTRVDPASPAALQIDRGNRLMESYRSNRNVADDAIGAFRSAVRADPNNAEAYVGLSRAYGTARDYATELSTAKDAVRRFPDYPAAHFQLAFALGDNNQFAQAITEFEKVRAMQPGYEHLDVQMSWTYTQLGEHAKAIDAARRAVAREPNYAFGYQQLGEALYAGGKNEEAVAAFQKASALNPSDPWGYKRLADTYNVLDRNRDALAVLQKAVERCPQELVLAIDYGTCLEKNGEHEEGLQQLARAQAIAEQKLAASPNDVQTINSLGVTQEYQGDLDAAAATYSRILAITDKNSSDHTLALSNLGNTSMKAHRYLEAASFFRRAYDISHQPGDQRMIVLSLFCAGNNAEALAEADKWLAANPHATHTGRYMGIHTHVIALGTPGADAARYLAVAQELNDPEWPAPCVDYLAGKISDADLLAKATDNDKLTEAHTYIGFKQVFAKNNAGIEHLQWVQKNGNPHYTETDQAIAWLMRNKE
jgi:tetratricopeptide (TPR) repeat protein